MVNLGGILFPLYIYPYPATRWDPLIAAAQQYRDVTFTAVVNPDNGPGADSTGCPNKDFVGAIAKLNAEPNIVTMGYVHTANRWDCSGPADSQRPGTGTDICFASAPYATVMKNISTYGSWNTCVGWDGAQHDVHMDSLFIDEAPGQDNFKFGAYMTNLTNFAKSNFVNAANNGTVLFNAGAQTDSRYFNVADTIIVLENTEQFYESIPDIDTWVWGSGTKYPSKASILLYNHTTTQGTTSTYNTVAYNVDTILSRKHDAFASVFISNLIGNQYAEFPTDWANITSAVNYTVTANKICVANNTC
ncbi:hypothetical protein DOTSEDRAFT_29691 [Dothistroma septosporum NZE10]|uniref:Uncharacterized protein n=1 Tax=Dothistroma septosporum (strain NZE10 / CBS 128990) TaxID=675120 RepID=M2YHX4_DOTSN|nr:hypothetical protein DOTSEDRAFT_29691 [Dothistroma septosporum NZE10]